MGETLPKKLFLKDRAVTLSALFCYVWSFHAIFVVVVLLMTMDHTKKYSYFELTEMNTMGKFLIKKWIHLKIFKIN